MFHTCIYFFTSKFWNHRNLYMLTRIPIFFSLNITNNAFGCTVVGWDDSNHLAQMYLLYSYTVQSILCSSEIFMRIGNNIKYKTVVGWNEHCRSFLRWSFSGRLIGAFLNWVNWDRPCVAIKFYIEFNFEITSFTSF